MFFHRLRADCALGTRETAINTPRGGGGGGGGGVTVPGCRGAGLGLDLAFPDIWEASARGGVGAGRRAHVWVRGCAACSGEINAAP